MSRAKNVANIELSDLDWNGDALTVLFCVMKTDTGGDRKFARHVYANPFQPEICPILGLGVYLLLLDVPGDGPAKLFPGGSQYMHFSEAFSEVSRTHARAVCAVHQERG